MQEQGLSLVLKQSVHETLPNRGCWVWGGGDKTVQEMMLLLYNLLHGMRSCICVYGVA